MATRPTIKDWEDEGKITLLKGWARNGLTEEQIAHNMGICKTTLWEWKKKYPNFAEALKTSRDEADLAVENALYKAALEGNTTAQIFWLKNRRRNDWRDKVEQDVSHEIKVTLPESVSEYAD